MVEVYLKSNPEKKYTLSKDLLCSRSDFFDACFNGNFLEGQTQVVHLDEEIQAETFEMLLQWLYTSKATQFPPPCEIAHKEGENLAEVIKIPERREVYVKKMDEFHHSLSAHLDFISLSESLLFNPSPNKSFANGLAYHLLNLGWYFGGKEEKPWGPVFPEHLRRIWQRPRADPIREMMAIIVTEVYMREFTDTYVYEAELEDLEGFARDVLKVYGQAVKEGG